ncbi:MAG TPA: hypothetical protein VF778_11875, partial [Xanthobacteraceae bacterium]
VMPIQSTIVRYFEGLHRRGEIIARQASDKLTVGLLPPATSDSFSSAMQSEMANTEISVSWRTGPMIPISGDYSVRSNTASGTSRIIASLARAYLLLRKAANPAACENPTEPTMRISSILRTATLALSLVAAMGATGTAFAASRVQQQEATYSNSSPYDSPDFVVAPTDIHP